MRIIIYDNNKNSMEELCFLIKHLPFDMQIDKLTHSDDFLDTYVKHTYDIVFIDFNDGVGKKLKKEIMDINPLQKVVSINNSFECSDTLGCEHCKSETNNFRIFKPINISDIVKSTQDTKCERDYCDGSLESKLHIIANSFEDFTFDESTFRFLIARYSKDLFKHSNLIELQSILQTNNISHSVEDDYIQVSMVE